MVASDAISKCASALDSVYGLPPFCKAPRLDQRDRFAPVYPACLVSILCSGPDELPRISSFSAKRVVVTQGIQQVLDMQV